MKIPLTVNEKLAARARACGCARNSSLSQIIRDYMEWIMGRMDPQQAFWEFADIARHCAGRSVDEDRLDRNQYHERGRTR